MKTGVRLLVSSMLFAVVVGALYAATTRDVAGIVLLGFMAVAFFIMAAYVALAERNVRLRSDDESSQPADGAGEMIGTFALESYWPPLAALALAVALFGVTFLPGFAIGILVAALFASFLTVRLLMREST